MYWHSPFTCREGLLGYVHRLFKDDSNISLDTIKFLEETDHLPTITACYVLYRIMASSVHQTHYSIELLKKDTDDSTLQYRAIKKRD